MVSIGIFYFSGTGNTEIVAKLLVSAFERRLAKVELIKIEDILYKKAKFDPNKYDFIGIGHPVLGFDATGIVYKFAKMLPQAEGKKTFVFKIAADSLFINNGASKSIIKIIGKKGYKVFHDSLFAMPCNFIMKFEDRFVKQLYEAAVKKVEKISEEILNEKAAKLKLNIILRGLCKLTYYGEEKLGARMFGKGLKATEACIKCKKCLRDCPTKNISYENNHIKFGSKCIWCMKCIYSCPKAAIKASRFKFCVLKKEYNGGSNIQKILDNPEIKGDFITTKTKGYFKHYYKYLNKG